MCDPWISLPEVADMGTVFDDYDQLEANANKEIEKTILKEVANHFTVSKYEEAATILLLSKTLYIFSEFIKKHEQKSKFGFNVDLYHFTEVLLGNQNSLGKRIAKKHLKKYVTILNKTQNAGAKKTSQRTPLGKRNGKSTLEP